MLDSSQQFMPQFVINYLAHLKERLFSIDPEYRTLSHQLLYLCRLVLNPQISKSPVLFYFHFSVISTLIEYFHMQKF